MTGDTTPPAVRLLAERLWKEYDSQYSADHLTWVDFEPEARGHLKALADAGLLCSSPDGQPQEQDQGRFAPGPSALTGDLSAHASPTAYQVSCLPLSHAAAVHLSVWVKWRGEDRWAVLNNVGLCLGTDGEWDYEGMPSSRSDEWIATHRFELAKALRFAREAAPHLRVNGLTVQDVLGGKFHG